MMLNGVKAYSVVAFDGENLAANITLRFFHSVLQDKCEPIMSNCLYTGENSFYTCHFQSWIFAKVATYLHQLYNWLLEP